MSTIYALMLWRGFRLIRTAKSIEAAGGSLRCWSDGCEVVTAKPWPPAGRPQPRRLPPSGRGPADQRDGGRLETSQAEGARDSIFHRVRPERDDLQQPALRLGTAAGPRLLGYPKGEEALRAWYRRDQVRAESFDR